MKPAMAKVATTAKRARRSSTSSPLGKFLNIRGAALRENASALERNLENYDGLGFAENACPIAGCCQVDARGLGFLIEGAYLGNDIDRHGSRIGNLDRACEPHRVTADLSGVTEPVADHIDDRSHGPHSVRDHAGETHFEGETPISVNGVAVA